MEGLILEILRERTTSYCTGSLSSKYEHRRASALLRNIQNIRICMGKKPTVSVTYENERISIKNSLPYLKCVTSLLCGPRADLWPFYGFLCKRFSLYIKVYREKTVYMYVRRQLDS